MEGSDINAKDVHSSLFGVMKANVLTNCLFGLNIGLWENKHWIGFVNKVDTVKVRFNDCSNII
jgi:hypothetical protein